jgi:hypothetical protein
MSPTFIYGNWSAYDELSDTVPLDETLAMRQLENLLRLRSQGVRFDGYLMDAFWFARDGAYRTWRKPHWPNGPDRWLNACLENALLPGLWFASNNLSHLDAAPAWADSVNKDGWGLSFSEGGFLADFMAALQHWHDRGVRIYKFDFAEFGVIPKGKESTLEPAEARSRSIAAFRDALAKFRAKNPDAILMAYNGFDERECTNRSDRLPGRYMDPKWLEVFDSIYCGDPRPSDLPCADFWRSVDIYSDCLARLYESSDIPLDRIDNSAFMAGNTGTCYWRGKAGWKQMLILSLARGGRYHVAYGDLSLFDDVDAQFWAQAQRAYTPLMKQGATTSFGGWPGAGEPYGWLGAAPGFAIATVVNPGIGPDVIELPILPEASWHLVGGKVDSKEGLLLLEAGQVAVFTTDTLLELSLEAEQNLSVAGPPVATAQGDTPLTLALSTALPPGNYRLVITQTDRDGNALRTYPGKDFQPPFAVTLVTPVGRELLPPMTDRKIWSGLSWWLIDIEIEGTPATLEIVSQDPHNPLLTAELYERHI